MVLCFSRLPIVRYFSADWLAPWTEKMIQCSNQVMTLPILVAWFLDYSQQASMELGWNRTKGYPKTYSKYTFMLPCQRPISKAPTFSLTHVLGTSQDLKVDCHWKVSMQKVPTIWLGTTCSCCVPIHVAFSTTQSSVPIDLNTVYWYHFEHNSTLSLKLYLLVKDKIWGI